MIMSIKVGEIYEMRDRITELNKENHKLQSEFDDALTTAGLFKQKSDELQAELEEQKKVYSKLYTEKIMIGDRFQECFECNQNCIDEIARLKDALLNLKHYASDGSDEQKIIDQALNKQKGE